MPYPITPDGRHFVIRARLWRIANPDVPEEVRAQLVVDLMRARPAVTVALRTKNANVEMLAREAFNVTKRSLGERGPMWWSDGAPDYNRRMVRNTPYAEWYAMLGIE